MNGVIASRHPGPRARRGQRLVGVVVGVALAAVVVPPASASGQAAEAGGTAAPSASLEVIGSVEQLAIVGADHDADVRLSSAGVELAAGRADAFGSLLFRDVEPGEGYHVTVERADGSVHLGPVDVLAVTDVPGPDLYTRQRIAVGQVENAAPTRAEVREAMQRGYVEVRDGILLSVTAVAPAGEGPWPTLIEYTGYDTGWNESSQWSALVAEGYAVVGVNIRGTGCSGGAFDYFEPLHGLDGYDVVETIAAQGWSDGIGMIGWSYAGISQLFVGATQPPSLDALVPGSTVGDLYRDVLRPGGILNPGFGLFFGSVLDQESAPPRLWLDDELPIGPRDRYPSPLYGPDFDGVPQRIQGWQPDIFDPTRGAAIYDTPEAATCRANHALRLQNDLLLQRADVEVPAPGSLIDEYFDLRAPSNHVADIAAPTLLVHTWHDEQTAGRAALMGEAFDPDVLWFIGTNGDHREYTMTHVRADIDDFLTAFVKGDTERRAAWEGRDRVTIHLGTLETGFALPPGSANPADATFTHAPAATATFPTFPAWSEAGDDDVLRLHLHPDGSLRDEAAPSNGGWTGYDARAGARPEPDWITGIGFGWVASGSPFLPGGNPWRPVPDDAAASFVTEPFEQAVTLVGPASVDLWVASDAEDTDLEVQLSEIRPDGEEVFLNTGWLRASQRALDETATSVLQPVHTHRLEDIQPLVPNAFTPVRVEVFPFGHVLHPGSRLKLSIEAPSGNRLNYRFRSVADGEHNRVGHASAWPSSIALPIVDVDDVGDPITRCWADSTRSYLNSQPCLEPASSAPPAAPTVTPRITVDDGRLLDVSWEAPALRDGHELTGYRVVAAPGGEVQQVGPDTTAATLSIDEALDGQEITVRVQTLTSVEFRGEELVRRSPIGPATTIRAPDRVGFTDVDDTTTHRPAILQLAIDGVVTGYPDGSYRPRASMTRGQFASVLLRAGGLAPAEASPRFPDAVGSVHAPAIEALAEAGIVDGFADGTFRPNAALRRDQAAALLARWLALPPVEDGPFEDLTTSVHRPAVNALAAAGVIEGTGPTTYSPRDLLSRGQLATIVHRARDLQPME